MNVDSTLPTKAEAAAFLRLKSGTNVESLLLTTAEAAKLLRLSPGSLERYRLLGTGPRYFKLGPGLRARVVYRLDDLYAWIDRSFLATSEYSS